MSDETLNFKRIEIHRMPGFRTGFTLDGIRPGLNVVFGPNASGKTTTVRAMNALLWPRSAPEPSAVTGHFEYGGASWVIDIDNGHRRCQREGKDHDPPPLPSPEARDRYNLGLHELLFDVNAPFARAIAQETAGGYDIAAASEELRFHPGASPRKTEQKTYGEARKAVGEAARKQENLRSEEQRLEELQKERKEAARAQQMVNLLSRALEYAAAKQRHEEASERMNRFPEGMDKIAEGDDEALADLREKIRRERQTRDDSEQEREKATDDLRACALPDEGVPPERIPSLRQKRQRLGEQQGTIERLKGELSSARREEGEARRRIGEAVTDEHLAGLERVGLDELAEFARGAEGLRARRKLCERMKEWLKPDERAEEPDRLRRGRSVLMEWLKAEARRKSKTALPWWLILLTAVLLITASGLLGLFVHWLCALLSILGIAVVVAAVRHAVQDKRYGPPPKAYLEEEFHRLGIGSPETWSSEAVSGLLGDLDRRLAAAEFEVERARRRHDVDAEEKKLDVEAEAVDRQRESLMERFGVTPEGDRVVDEASLFVLANSVSRWQAVHERTVRLEEQLQEAERQFHDLLSEINEKLLPYGYPPAADADEALGNIEALHGRQQKFTTATNKIENAIRNLESAAKRLATVESDYRDFFARRDLEEDDEVALRQRLELREDYIEAKKELAESQFELKRTAEALKEQQALAERPQHELEEELRGAKERAEKLETVAGQIGGIEARIEDAKRGHELGDALARLEKCREELRQGRDEDYTAVAGWVLADFLKRETQERSQPAVFHRANRLFSEITRGRCTLTAVEADSPTFRAMETVTEMGLGLDELSSATRLQLLLAVRIAFVEEQEHGVRLPLFFDEALGNSDDERARAIIEAALELVRQGRQVFYFTAQEDEVNKWRGVIEQKKDVTVNFIDLGKARDLAELERLPLLVGSPLGAATPDPAGMGYEEYGHALGVPGIDPSVEHIGGLHLWHVLKDAETLCRLMRLGVRTWGQFVTLARQGRMELPSIEEDTFHRAEACAKAIKEAASCWHVGRGKKVERQVLEESGQVSPTFIDRVNELTERLDGDARELIAALKAGMVSRFHSSKIEGLEEYLEQNGYIDDRNRMDLEEAQIKVKAALAVDIEDGLITPKRVDKLVERVYAFVEV